MKKPKTSQDSGVWRRELIFCNEPLRRPNYFNGRLLGADDLIAEQEYHRNKQRRHNLHCHGIGVVNGLEVSTAKGDSGWSVIVGAGVAIDPAGNEVHVCEPVRLPLPESHVVVRVGIRYSERFSGSFPATGNISESVTEPAQVQEGCEVVLEPGPDSMNSPASPCAGSNSIDVLPLARVVRRRNAWRLDRTFKAARSH